MTSLTDIDRLLTEVASSSLASPSRLRVDSLFANPAGIDDDEEARWLSAGAPPSSRGGGGALCMCPMVPDPDDPRPNPRRVHECVPLYRKESLGFHSPWNSPPTKRPNNDDVRNDPNLAPVYPHA